MKLDNPWDSGSPYEPFMGRWSRKIALILLDWLNAAEATELISDPRVRHYRNDDFIAGEFFKDHDFGRTVIRKRQALQDTLLALCEEK